MKADFYCFFRNGKYYAIDTIRIIPLQIEYNVYCLLNKIQSEKSDINIEDFVYKDGYSIIKELFNQDILFHNNMYKIENSFKEINLSLVPTLACNLNCKYCYSKRKNEYRDMPIKIINDAIDFFCSYYPFSYCRVDFVSGGEPLYNPQLLFKIISVLSDLLKQNEKKVLFWLCTNGLLLNDQILQFLDHYNFNIGISIDGPEEINDSNRIDLAGNGTYKKLIDKVNYLKNDKNLSRNIKNIWNCAVITSSTHSLVDVMKNSYRLGFQNLQMKLVWSNDGSMRLSVNETIQLYNVLTDYLFELIKENRLDEFLCICNENDTYGKILLRIIIQSGVTRRCNAGVNKFSISPEGNLYPCDSFLGIEEYCIGNIYKGLNDVYNEFKNMRNDNIEKCKVCWAKYLCGGDCYYHSYLNSGSPWIPDDKVCHIMKEISMMCIALVVDLYCSYPKKMQSIYAILSKRVTRMEPKK